MIFVIIGLLVALIVVKQSSLASQGVSGPIRIKTFIIDVLCHIVLVVLLFWWAAYNGVFSNSN